MAGKTTIEWTAQPGYVGAVWNPTTGCTRVSAGCDNCYAFALHDKHYASNLKVARALPYDRETGPGGSYKPAGARQLGVKLPWPQQYDLPFSRVQLLPERLDAPLRTRKPTCYFVDSMADLFHEGVPDAYIARVFDSMRLASQHRFLILTKRPERMRELVTDMGEAGGAYDFTEDGGAWPLPNVWLGTSVEDQASADERIPHLLATPAAVRFLSCEPLLGPVNLDEHVAAPGEAIVLCPKCGNQRWVGPGTCRMCGAPPPPSIDWCIVGGESGPRARPMDLAWARSLVDQCRAVGVTPFVKQLGSQPTSTHPDDLYDVDDAGRGRSLVRESHGREMTEWPEDLRIREFPR